MARRLPRKLKKPVRRKLRPTTRPRVDQQPPPPIGFAPKGRRTVLTPDLQQEICSKLAAGDSMKDAVVSSGVSVSAAYRWLQEGGQPNAAQPLKDFLEAVGQAEATRRRLFKSLIRKSAIGTPRKMGDWRAAAHLGAMTDPEDFVPQVRVHISGQLDEALDRLKEAFADDPEAYERAVHALAGGTRGASPGGPSAGTGGQDAGGGEAVHSPPPKP